MSKDVFEYVSTKRELIANVLREEKTENIVLLSSRKNLLLRPSTFISEKSIDSHQKLKIKMIGKNVGKRTKTAKTVPTAFEKNFAFEGFDLHFREND